MKKEIEKSMEELQKLWKPEAICATCKHLKSEPKEANKVGLFRCGYLPGWTYKAPNGHCDKWTLANDADKRVEWFKLKGWL